MVMGFQESCIKGEAPFQLSVAHRVMKELQGSKVWAIPKRTTELSGTEAREGVRLLLAAALVRPCVFLGQPTGPLAPTSVLEGVPV